MKFFEFIGNWIGTIIVVAISMLILKSCFPLVF